MEIAVGHGRVDSDKGVIYDAKIVGLESRNIGRTIGLDPREFGDAINKPYGYSKLALESAIPLYEGAILRVNHPKSELDDTGKRIVTQRTRGLFDTVGEVRNVRMKEDGLYGDLYLLKSNKSVPFILEAAERMPDKIALSHNAYGLPTLKNGKAVIDSIEKVYSVDIVGDKPGTTNGLFESFEGEEPKVIKKKIKEIFESIPSSHWFRSQLLECMGNGDYGKNVAEMDVSYDSPAAPDSDTMAKDAFRAMVMAAFDDDSLDDAATAKRIKEILMAKQKLSSSSEPKAAPESEGGEDMQETQLREKEALLESRLKSVETELADKKAELAARELLESMGREPTPGRIRMLKKADNDAERKAFIEEWAKVEAPAATTPLVARPRYVTVQESTADSGEKTLEGKDLIAAINR